MLRYLFGLITVSIVAPQLALAEPPSPYEQLRDRLLSGKETVSISDLKKCTQKSGTIITNIRSVGGFWIDAFQILPEPNAHIAYADEHFTVTPDGAPVIEFLQYRVASNNIGTLTVRRLSPVTYKPLSEPIVFECQIGDGLRFLPEEGLLPAN